MSLELRLVGLVPLLCTLGFAQGVEAHCDTLTGPVVAAARLALQTNDVTPVLKWVRQSEEAEVRQTFQKVTAVRELDSVAKDLADRFFFEAVVRLHRLGEGEPYTGLKDDTEIDPAAQSADKALEDGNVEPLVKLLVAHVSNGLRERFARVRELQTHADDSVDRGRRYVEAYVDFVHFVEQLHSLGTEAEIQDAAPPFAR